MKKNILALMGIIVIMPLFFSGCINQEYSIRAKQLSQIPTNPVNIAETQMQSYPHLLEAINTNTSVKTPKVEFDQLHTLLTNKTELLIRYQDKYCKITIIFAD